MEPDTYDCQKGRPAATHASAEGTSLNTLVTMLLAEGLGRREHLA